MVLQHGQRDCEGNEGVLLIGNPNSPQKIAMKNIVRVDTGVEGMLPGIQNMGIQSGAVNPLAQMQARGMNPLAMQQPQLQAQDDDGNANPSLNPLMNPGAQQQPQLLSG